MRPRRSGSDGYITLTVLVVAGLLASLVSTLLLVSRASLGYTRIGAEDVGAAALVDGGLAAAGYLLFAAERDAVAVDGTVLRFQTGRVRLGVADEAGRIDLNAAPLELLAGLYAAVDGRSLAPEAFAARVTDWRDADAEQSEGGAEAPDYVAATAPYHIRNGPFATVAELGFLLGLSRADFERLEPFVTVFNVEGTIDPLSASRPVLAAIPDFSTSDLAALLEARAAGVTDRATILAAMQAPPASLRGDASGVYRIRIEARLTEGFASEAEAVVMAPADEKTDYGVLAWSALAARPR